MPNPETITTVERFVPTLAQRQHGVTVLTFDPPRCEWHDAGQRPESMQPASERLEASCGHASALCERHANRMRDNLAAATIARRAFWCEPHKIAVSIRFVPVPR